MARKVAIVGVIASVYTVLTVAFAPISYGFVQFRVSEVMTILPFLTPLAIPGLFIGAFFANWWSLLGVVDVVFGSLASLIAAYFTYKMPSKWLAPLPPVLVNAVIIGTVWGLAAPGEVGIIAAMIYVGIGQLVICYGLGLPVLHLLLRRLGQSKDSFLR
mgnify:CR=1 FL=1